MLNKNLLVLLCAALLTGLVVERRWNLLLTPWLAAGVAIALVIASPNLLWQADHGWPQLDMARVLSERLAAENRATLLPLQLLFVGPVYVVVLWRGARWLAGDPRAAPVPAAALGVAGRAAGRLRHRRPPVLRAAADDVVVLAGVVAADRREPPHPVRAPGHRERRVQRRVRSTRLALVRHQGDRRAERGRRRDGGLARAR